MTLTETLLPKLSEWRPAGGGRHTWSDTVAGWAVHLAADKTDSLSCLVWELSLTRVSDAPAGLTNASWAAATSKRVTGLMEPLKVHEVDVTRDEALLRSAAPARRGEALAYYEILLHGVTRAVVRRYAAGPIPGREQVAFALTHEVLAKLVGDIAG